MLEFSKCYALEVGAGNGGLSLWLALNGCHVICSDLNGPTEKAKELHKKYKVSDLIEYASVDATNIPYKENTFDIVAFKSIIGGIGGYGGFEKEMNVFKEIHRVLKPKGELFFAENLDGSLLHKFIRKKIASRFKRYKWTSTWRWVTLKELEEFLSPFSSKKYMTYGFLAHFTYPIQIFGIFLGQ